MNDEILDSLDSLPLKQRLDLLKKLRQQASDVQDSVNWDLNSYFKAICAAQGLQGHTYNQADRFEIEEDCVRFFLEVNTSCHCHPEMETKEFELPLALLHLSPDEVQKHLKEQLSIEKNRKEALEKDQKSIAEEKAKANKMQREKEQYEELKKKFETVEGL